MNLICTRLKWHQYRNFMMMEMIIKFWEIKTFKNLLRITVLDFCPFLTLLCSLTLSIPIVNKHEIVRDTHTHTHSLSIISVNLRSWARYNCVTLRCHNYSNSTLSACNYAIEFWAKFASSPDYPPNRCLHVYAYVVSPNISQYFPIPSLSSSRHSALRRSSFVPIRGSYRSSSPPAARIISRIELRLCRRALDPQI